MKNELPVQWLSLALQDIREIFEYLAKEDIETAEKVASLIWQSGKSLSCSPERGRPGRVYATRELLLTPMPYFVAYRVKGKQVQILRVIHTSRQWPLA